MSSGESNAQQNLDIDAIVREVFARLAATAETGSAETNAASDELMLSAMVVSLGELEERLKGARRVIVPKGAVITPAARDLLASQRINVSYAIRETAGFGHRLLVGLAETRYEPAALLRSLGQAGTAIERLANTGLLNVTDELCDGVAKGGQLGLLLTDRIAAAICLANRRPGVRAALAADKRQIAEAVADVGVNLLVMAPTAHGFFELKQMVSEFMKGGARKCPESLKERLA